MENKQKLQALRNHIASSWGVEDKRYTAGSTTYSYLEAGRENTSTIIFLHGLGCSKQHWRGLMVLLKNHFHVIALDIPGFHHSTFLECGQYALSSLDGWLTNFLESLQIRQYNLVGFSAGACLAALHASKQKNANLRSVAFLGFPDLVYSEGNLFRNAFDYCKFSSVETREQLEKIWCEQFHEAPKLPRFMSKAHLEDYINKKPQLLTMMQALSDSSAPLMARVHLIKVPLLSIRGSSDKISGLETIAFLKRAVPNLQESTIRNAGHLAYFEKQREVADAISAFVVRHPLEQNSRLLDNIGITAN